MSEDFYVNRVRALFVTKTLKALNATTIDDGIDKLAKLAALLAAADMVVKATGARETGLAQYDLQVALADFRAERSGL